MGLQLQLQMQELINKYLINYKNMDISDREWIVYCLESYDNKCSYIGSTNHPYKRLRQHNGLIKGGAKYTNKRRPWFPVIIVQGFLNRSQACQFEWAWKHIRISGKRGGLKRRIKNLYHLIYKKRWTLSSINSRNIHLHITLMFYYWAY